MLFECQPTVYATSTSRVALLMLLTGKTKEWVATLYSYQFPFRAEPRNTFIPISTEFKVEVQILCLRQNHRPVHNYAADFCTLAAKVNWVDLNYPRRYVCILCGKGNQCLSCSIRQGNKEARRLWREHHLAPADQLDGRPGGTGVRWTACLFPSEDQEIQRTAGLTSTGGAETGSQQAGGPETKTLEASGPETGGLEAGGPETGGLVVRDTSSLTVSGDLQGTAIG